MPRSRKERDVPEGGRVTLNLHLKGTFGLTIIIKMNRNMQETIIERVLSLIGEQVSLDDYDFHILSNDTQISLIVEDRDKAWKIVQDYDNYQEIYCLSKTETPHFCVPKDIMEIANTMRWLNAEGKLSFVYCAFWED